MKLKFLLVFSLFFQMIFAQEKLPLIPYPQKVEIQNGFFKIPNTITINSDNFSKKDLNKIFFELNYFNGTNLKFKKNKSKNSNISFGILPPQKDNNSYVIKIFQKEIIIESLNETSRFYALNTLFQILNFYENQGKIPCMTIEDSPKFSWRGMHLDVCRHFFPKEFVKKYIDFLAMYKMNTFHWHLTDDQGWRIEIKKYPKLTEIGAWRNGSMVGHYTEQKFDDKKYGGFYTQEEIKEIVKYAQERHINIVPEIEMPGHTVAAIASYPELGCTGKQIEVQKMWGVFDDIFCPKEETFTFLENVLTEVMELFPSKIIHIGGDEAPKTQWKESVFCQDLIKKLGLKDEHELQSYFVQRIEKFLNSKGRKIIGWDEILEGGLAPNASVMSWRGTEGGIAAAQQNHDVVMTPGDFCYFDHYQGNPKNEPVAIGGYTTVEKVYSFNPIPKELTAEQSKYILGAQGNVWSEYILNPQHVEYMVFPRITAMAEVLWGTNNDYSDYQKRLFQHFKVLDAKNINYSKAIFEVSSNVNISPKNNGVLVDLKSINGDKNIKYTLDGSIPTENSKLYTEPIFIDKTSTLKAAFFDGNKMLSTPLESRFYASKSLGKKITVAQTPLKKYYGIGASTLVDGIKGNPEKYQTEWLGFCGNNIDAVIDFEQKTNFNSLKTNFLENHGSWIHFPKKMQVSISDDGVNYQLIKEVSKDEIYNNKGIINLNFGNQQARFVKIVVENLGLIPEGKPGANNPSCLFMDEILID